MKYQHLNKNLVFFDCKSLDKLKKGDFVIPHSSFYVKLPEPASLVTSLGVVYKIDRRKRFPYKIAVNNTYPPLYEGNSQMFKQILETKPIKMSPSGFNPEIWSAHKLTHLASLKKYGKKLEGGEEARNAARVMGFKEYSWTKNEDGIIHITNEGTFLMVLRRLYERLFK